MGKPVTVVSLPPPAPARPRARTRQMTPTSTASPRTATSHLAPDADRPEAMVEQMRRLVGRNALRWKLLSLLEAAGLFVAVPLAYLWATILLDNALHLPAWGRALAAAGLIVAVALTGFRL